MRPWGTPFHETGMFSIHHFLFLCKFFQNRRAQRGNVFNISLIFLSFFFHAAGGVNEKSEHKC